jgi:hypothetical protein
MRKLQILYLFKCCGYGTRAATIHAYQVFLYSLQLQVIMVKYDIAVLRKLQGPGS